MTVLTRQQLDVRNGARDFLSAEYPPSRVRALILGDGGGDASRAAAWSALVALGWPGLAVEESAGGLGLGAVERCLLLEQLGASLLPTPFLSTAVLAVDLLSHVADEPQRADLLSGIAAGTSRLAVVVGGDLVSLGATAGQVTATTSGRNWALHGDGGLVLDGFEADGLLVVAATDGDLGLFELPAVTATRAIVGLVDSGRPCARISFDAAPARRLDAGDRVRDWITVALACSAVGVAAELVGAAQRSLDVTLEYLRTRHQFGVPIGSFQALKHRCANLAVDIAIARDLTYAAAELDESDRVFAELAWSAKARASEALLAMAIESIQMHGGIGFTWEHDAHLFYKRALLGAQLLGSPLILRDRVATGLGF